MLLLQERVVLPGGVLEVELHSDRQYCLRYADVEYRNDRSRNGTRTTPSEFRSVEQLRYDFEREVRAAGASFG